MPNAKGSAPAPARIGAGPDLNDPTLYINRELSWLEFNRRVLAQAEDADHPLLERLKFLSIVGTNLDEFFMIRVASLLRQQRTGLDHPGPDGWTTLTLLHAIREEAAEMLRRQAACWNTMLRPALAAQGVRVLEPADWTPAITEYLSSYFMREIWPVLTPLAFDPGHPFPFISNQSTNFAVVIKYAGHTRFARVKLPRPLPRFLLVPPSVAGATGASHVYLEDVVRANLGALFPGVSVHGAYLFRVIRDADLVIQEDEAHDLLELIDEGLRQQRHGALAMLQVEHGMPRRVLDTLIENFAIEEENVFRTKDRLGFDDWMELAGAVERPDLKYSPFPPVQIWPSHEQDRIFDDVRHRDRLVHIPFQSFAGAIETFLRAAVHDPLVVAIKMTLYRIGHDSPLPDLLVEAAEAGKQVAVLVELKARFDEQNNIFWAHRLEAAGVHVVYGVPHLKTHAKLCLVVRREPDGIQRYLHVGTGNYNAATARVYTDLGLFTSRPEIVEDASEVFNHLTGYANPRAYRQLLVAPTTLRREVAALIDAETAIAATGKPAHIIFKLNAITDHDMVRALYRASQAGVTVDLVVRGICCLKPGVPGVSDRITVRSIVGRFLEHSRIYWFLNGGSPRVFLGSADLMERNLNRRVEVLCPIHDADIAAHLRDVVLATYLQDCRRCRLLASNGTYIPATGHETPAAASAQDLMREHYARAAESDRASRPAEAG